MIRIFKFKLFVNKTQMMTLNRWRRTCCTLYNAAQMEAAAMREGPPNPAQGLRLVGPDGKP